jgi:signal transduction histidine kinase/DNA-binding response OmpR family regulator
LELTRLFYNNLSKSLVEIELGARSAGFRIEVMPKTVMVSLAPVAFGSEELPSTVALLRDISQEAEVERLKNEFISTVSHELRTPMTSIKGYADLLLSSKANLGDLKPTQRRFVGIIQSNANRLTDLVNDILEISRIETGRIKLNFVSLDIVELIEDVAESFEAQMVEKSLSVSLDLPDSLPNIYADQARLTQIIINLVGNAWQYTPENGTVNIRAKVVDDFMQVDVADSGIGIVEQDLEYIFDRFFRSERTAVQVVDGTGLGLSITKSFVEMLGGQISVTSEVDVGSTFSFTVPLDVARLADDTGAVDKAGLPAGSQLIVVSDDEEINNLISFDLKEQNHQLVVLNNAQVVLNFARKAGSEISLILVDVALRDTDGFDLLKQLRQINHAEDIPVLLFSLSVNESDDYLFLHSVDYIVTNFEEAQILASLELALSQSDTNDLEPRLRGPKPPTQLMIVEDDRTTSSRLKRLFLSAGYDVRCAFNGQQAMDMALGKKPDLILIGAKMPGFDGRSVIARLRTRGETEDIPIVLIVEESAGLQVDEAVAFLGARSGARFNQPIPVEQLITELLRLGEMPASA